MSRMAADFFIAYAHVTVWIRAPDNDPIVLIIIAADGRLTKVVI